MAHEVGSHRDHAAALRARVLVSGTATRELRAAALAGEMGGVTAPAPYSALIRQIWTDSARVTDAQVDAVRHAAGSEKDAFEVLLSAAIGAGLDRWVAAIDAIQEGNDAPS